MVDEMTKLYAQRGEVVTCKNGHRVCEIARDIELPGMEGPLWESVDDLTGWRAGDLTRMCPTCGEPFMFWVTKDTHLMGPLKLGSKFGPFLWIDGVARYPDELDAILDARHERNVERSLGR
jgi:hypothetical protein